MRVSRLLLGCRSAYFRTILTAQFADARHVEASGVHDLMLHSLIMLHSRIMLHSLITLVTPRDTPHQASGVLDLSQTLPGLSRPSLLALLRFIYTGRVDGGAGCGDAGSGVGSSAGGGAGGGAGGHVGGDADVECMAPQLALELLPPASALLLDELKSLCEGAAWPHRHAPSLQ